ncbi:MAG: hypothetical protein LBB14_00570 [Puniceicoccales bacterium]|jgi:hypothetical protein|nr:hypothetical protein [Puniceicoccales bacterium]
MTLIRVPVSFDPLPERSSFSLRPTGGDMPVAYEEHVTPVPSDFFERMSITASGVVSIYFAETGLEDLCDFFERRFGDVLAMTAYIVRACRARAAGDPVPEREATCAEGLLAATDPTAVVFSRVSGLRIPQDRFLDGTSFELVPDGMEWGEEAVTVTVPTVVFQCLISTIRWLTTTEIPDRDRISRFFWGHFIITLDAVQSVVAIYIAETDVEEELGEADRNFVVQQLGYAPPWLQLPEGREGLPEEEEESPEERLPDE